MFAGPPDTRAPPAPREFGSFDGVPGLGAAPGRAVRSLHRASAVRVIDDPYDPVFVTVGPAPGKVEIQIGEDAAARFARLTPDDALRLARALIDAAEKVQRKPP